MQIFLYTPETRSPVLAEITAMTKEHLRYVNATWPKAFQQRYRNNQYDEDAWMWNSAENRLDLLIERLRLKSVALVAGETVAGVLFLNCEARPSRLECRQPLVYITYVATAPWNRRTPNRVDQLQGVGRSLITWAAQYSQQIGCKGRLGLHSLKSSDAFYMRLGFRNFGIDAARRGMNYFERG